MDELQRRALARLPLSADEMRFTYTLARRSEVWKVVCESHERLRAELEGTTVLLRDAEAENARLSAEMLRLALEVGRLQGVIESLAARVAAQAELLGRKAERREM